MMQAPQQVRLGRTVCSPSFGSGSPASCHASGASSAWRLRCSSTSSRSIGCSVGAVPELPSCCSTAPFRSSQLRTSTSRQLPRLQATDGTDSEASTATVDTPRIKRTLSGLDALLGIQDEPADSSNGPSAPAAADSASATGNTVVSISPDAMSKMTAADAQRSAGVSKPKDEIDGQFQKIIEKARKLAEEQQAADGKPSGSIEAEQQKLRSEFNSLLQSMSSKPADILSKDDIKKLKDAAFGPQTFWVTETQAVTESERTGLLIRGNLRDERTKVFEHVCTKATELFGDKYTVLMVEDAAAEQERGASSSAALGSEQRGPRSSGAAAQAELLNTPRVAFQIVPAAQAQPPQTDGWKQVVALVMALLFVASCGQLALAANITKLPKETLEWFSNPANFESDTLPPGLDTWDPTAYFNSAVPIFSAVLGVNVTHELGHRLAAMVRSVKLGPTFFIPNFQLGAFGGITPFTSLLKDRLALWDVAAAGPLAGCCMAAAVLALGLIQSTGGADGATDMLVPVPTQLFQGSLMLGSIVRAVLGDKALSGAEVLVSPLVIAGWCGLVTQALQLLPVGSSDGGRMFQAAFGNQSLALSSFFTYLGLGLGLLGSSLALPYGLYVIICQRVAEKYIRDNVTTPGEGRATATGVAVLVAILVLLPMAPELANGLGVGQDRDMFL